MAFNYQNAGRFDTREKFGDKPGDKPKAEHDKPAFSRVFVVCGKQHTTEDLSAMFKECGTIEDVWLVKDRTTKENRGLAYIKFSKMSEACMAIDTLNGKKLSEDSGGPPLKVIMAQPKSSKSKEDFDDETALTRIFVILPKGTEESELREGFEKFGDIEYVNVVKDRKTGEKKGFGYVKFRHAYDAAKAVEDSDKAYRAVMAEPKAKKKRDMGNDVTGLGVSQANFSAISDWALSASKQAAKPLQQLPSVQALGFDDGLRTATIGNRLQVNCAFSVSADQLACLFDLVPGMELCDLKRNFSTGESKGLAVVVYNSIGAATYAKEKLHGFEYPPGFQLYVRYAPDGGTDVAVPSSNDMVTIGNIRNSGTTPIGYGGNSAVITPSLCSVSLPPAKPKCDNITEECAERLFIVCQPAPPPPHILTDVFSRFGDLMDVFMLKNKNFGYAKYASAEAAKKAMTTLHGAEVYGAKLKVLTAEPPKTPDSPRKRPRT